MFIADLCGDIRMQQGPGAAEILAHTCKNDKAALDRGFEQIFELYRLYVGEFYDAFPRDFGVVFERQPISFLRNADDAHFFR